MLALHRSPQPSYTNTCTYSSQELHQSTPRLSITHHPKVTTIGLSIRYTIDLRLGAHESALRNIVSAGNECHEDCMKLLNANPQLFPLGLQLFNEPEKRNEILEAWGDHLSEEKCFGDAALTYQCCSSYQKSLKDYRACGDWKGVFTVAGILELEKEEITQLAHELCDEFQALGKPGDAARVALKYCVAARLINSAQLPLDHAP